MLFYPPFVHRRIRLMPPSDSKRSLPPEATSTDLIVEMLVILSRSTPPVVIELSLNCKFKLTPAAQAWTFLAWDTGQDP
jgi:hypothetical protein